MNGSLWTLLLSAGGVALVHTLAPDHWVPFAALARAQGWSRRRLLGVTLAAGAGHVGSSLLIGVIALSLGWALDIVQVLQSTQGTFSLYLLIAFGVVYAGIGLWRARGWGEAHVHGGELHTHAHGTEPHVHAASVRGISSWSLFVIFVLGPCEALLPLMFAAVPLGSGAVVATSLLFSACTVATMVTLSFLAASGFRLLRVEAVENHLQVFTGGAISATAALVLVLGDLTDAIALGLYPRNSRGGVLVVLAFFAALGGLGVAIRSGCEEVAAQRLGAALLWTGAAFVVAIVYVASRRVVAGENGLRLLGLVRRRNVPWKDVRSVVFEPIRGRRQPARLVLTTSTGPLALPADPRLAEALRRHAPELAPSLALVPGVAVSARRQAVQGLERCAIGAAVIAGAVVLSGLLPTPEARVIAGAALALFAAVWLYLTRHGPVLLLGRSGLTGIPGTDPVTGGPAFALQPGSEAPGILFRGAASLGESVAVGAVLLLFVNVAIGAAGLTMVEQEPAAVEQITAAPVAVRTWALAGRELDLPEKWAYRCSDDGESLVCATAHGWIVVRRDENDAGLLGGDLLREAATFRRADLRLDRLPHETMRWYVSGVMSQFFEKPPTAIVLRPDGGAAIYWRSRRGVQAMVATGGEILTVDLNGDAARDEALRDVLATTRARGSDLFCRFAGALGRERHPAPAAP